MVLSKNPKFLFLINQIFKKYRFLGLIASLIGVIYFCFFDKGYKNVHIDSRMFSEFYGNSILEEKNERYMESVTDYFKNYSYEKESHIIDILETYIKEHLPFLETERHKISVDKNIDDDILISTVPCKFCNNMENLIIVINFDFKEREYFHSLAVGLTLMDHFSKCDYMSKDIIYVFTNKELLYSNGINGFIEHYFYKNTKNRKSITRGAVIIEFDTLYPSYVHINYEGLNGLLPNQDFILLLTGQLSHYRIKVKTDIIFESVFKMALEKEHESGHIHFLRENVPAFTVRGTSKVSIKSKKMNLFAFTKSMESFLRCMSNTHEGLCHSTSFYFFDTVKRYTPISLYCYSVYLMCSFCILKLLKSRVLLNIFNFIIGITIYILNILVLSLPLYLFSTNEKIYNFLSIPNKLPICNEWHPDKFQHYFKIAESWFNIFLVSVIVVTILNYIFSLIINHIHKNQKYKKVEKIERGIILLEIKNLNDKKNQLYEDYLDEDRKHIDDKIGICKNYKSDQHNEQLNKIGLTKPQVIDSDDENLMMEKRKLQMISALEKKIEEQNKKLQLLKKENTKYIINQSIAPYSLIMKYANIFFFVFIVLSTSLYNWSLSILISLVFIVPISLQYKITQKSKKIYRKIFLLLFILIILLYLYPYEDAIANKRKIFNQLLKKNLRSCELFIESSKIAKFKYFPTEFFSFLCSAKWLNNLYLNKYFFQNKTIQLNYNIDIQNNVFLNMYNLAKNYVCIGTMTYPIWCFAVIPIIIHILFVFFF